MTHSLHRYECPACFLERFQPVKAYPGEKGLPAYLFDAYGLAFYQQLSTAAVPAAAVWSVSHQGDDLLLTHGYSVEAMAFIVAQRLPAIGEATAYSLPLRLGYRAKVAVQALQQLKRDLIRSASRDTGEAIALIDRRIERYQYPKDRPNSNRRH
jgi:hypothetical protein